MKPTHRVTFAMGHTDASGKSPNGAPWKTWSLKTLFHSIGCPTPQKWSEKASDALSDGQASVSQRQNESDRPRTSDSSTNQSLNQPITRFCDSSTNQSLVSATHQPINRSFLRLINQSIAHFCDSSTNQSLISGTHQPINHSFLRINQSITRFCDSSTNQSLVSETHQPINQSLNQPITRFWFHTRIIGKLRKSV